MWKKALQILYDHIGNKLQEKLQADPVKKFKDVNHFLCNNTEILKF
jgi:hypothetical protein